MLPGFTDETEVELGDRDCRIISLTPNEIVCISGTTATKHSVTNDGIHPSKYHLIFKHLPFVRYYDIYWESRV